MPNVKDPKSGQVLTMQERCQDYDKENAELMRKYELAVIPALFFPRAKRPPFLSRVAVKLIKLQGGTISLQAVDLSVQEQGQPKG